MTSNNPIDSSEWSTDELARYSRQLILPHVGRDGQQKLGNARVLLVGAGGLGSSAALYLAAAGVGTLGLVDFDTVDLSNLHRQILHGTSDVGRSKLDSAAERLHDLNPECTVVPHPVRLTRDNALEIIEQYDIVVDGTDNFATRYLINDACALLRKNNVYGSIYRFDGQVSVFCTDAGPCYRCLYPEPPPPGTVPSCAEGGVLGVLPGIIGTLQASEAIKLILGIGEPLIGRLLICDTLGAHWRTMTVRRRPGCPACDTRTLTRLPDYDAFCGTTTAQTAAPEDDMTPRELAARLADGPPLDLIDVREPWEWDVARIPGATLIPMGLFPDAISQLNPAHDIVVQCRSGVRSASVADLLRSHGFTHVWNLAGGILRWSDEVDPSVRRY